MIVFNGRLHTMGNNSTNSHIFTNKGKNTLMHELNVLSHIGLTLTNKTTIAYLTLKLEKNHETRSF